MDIKPNVFLGSLATAFITGAIVQAHYQIKCEKKLKKQIEILELEKQLANWFIVEGRTKHSREELRKELKERRQFIAIAKNLK